MKNKNKAKGAFMVEFALTLPMYLGVAFSTIFGSLMLHDEYVLQTTTQNLAREFAIDAASTVQTNAQTGIVYGNAVNSILKYRKTLDDSLYLYKTTNEKGKQCTISIECNARNVEGSSGVSGVTSTYNMYKLDSAYIVLKGKIVPKADLIPKLVQWVCPNTLDIIRKTRVELNINASLISKMAFDSEAGSKTGILYSGEYTADYGDYNTTPGGGTSGGGSSSADNTPIFNSVNMLIEENKIYAAARPSDYDDDYNNKTYLGSNDFESLLYDLINTPALNRIMYTYLNGNNIVGLVNELWKLGYLPTNNIDFFYSTSNNTEWNAYLYEYLRNYLQLPADYKIGGSAKTIIISDKNKSDFSPEQLDMLTAGSLLDAKQFLYITYTITAPDGTKQDYFAIFSCDDTNMKAMLTKYYDENVSTNSNNGITMINIGNSSEVPTEQGNYGTSNNTFVKDTQPTHTQYEGEYINSGSVYYKTDGTIETENTGRWTNVYYDVNQNLEGMYVKTHSGSGYYELVNPEDGVSNIVASNKGASWLAVYYDPTSTDNTGYNKIGNYYWALKDPDNGVASTDGTWNGAFFFDASGNNEGLYTKVTVGSATTYYSVTSTKDESYGGASFTKNTSDNLYYDSNNVYAGAYVYINNKYYLVDKNNSVSSTVAGTNWVTSYCDNSGKNEGIYTFKNNHYYEIDTKNKSDKTTGWDTLYYDSNNVYNGAYVNNNTGNNENNAYFQVKNPGAGIVPDSSTVWKSVRYDTSDKFEGAYVAANNVYYKIDTSQKAITNADWSANGAVAKNVYYDTSGVNEGSYIKAGDNYYKLVDNTSDIAVNSYQAKQLKKITGELYSDPTTDKQYIRYDSSSNSYYEVDTTVDPVHAPASGEANPWKNTILDTRMTYTQNTRRYYRTSNTINGEVFVRYLEVPDTVGQTDSEGVPVIEPWTLIYNDYKVGY